MNNTPEIKIVCNDDHRSTVLCIGSRIDYENFFSNLFPEKNECKSIASLFQRISDEIPIDNNRWSHYSNFSGNPKKDSIAFRRDFSVEHPEFTYQRTDGELILYRAREIEGSMLLCSVDRTKVRFIDVLIDELEMFDLEQGWTTEVIKPYDGLCAIAEIGENCYGTTIYIEEHTYDYGEEDTALEEMLSPSTLNIRNVLDLIFKPEQLVYQFEFLTAHEYVIDENED